MRLILLACCVSLLFANATSIAQGPKDVNLCQLEQNALQFDNKLVTVRAVANLGFEDFTLGGADCKTDNSVWLTFGGDVSDIATYCCGDHSRTPGQMLKIDGEPISLLKDANYKHFVHFLEASRNRLPDGERCFYRCNFYRVTATFAGLFLAKTGDRGYGHLGCCNLLVIEEISDVSAQRTLFQPAAASNAAPRCGSPKRTSWRP